MKLRTVADLMTLLSQYPPTMPIFIGETGDFDSITTDGTFPTSFYVYKTKLVIKPHEGQAFVASPAEEKVEHKKCTDFLMLSRSEKINVMGVDYFEWQKTQTDADGNYK